MKTFKLGTRGSPLARWQAGWVRAQLSQLGIQTELVIIRTSGDKQQKGPLALEGGKGLFIKELEAALADGSIDLAVHSLKDVPTLLEDDFALAAFLQRADPRDCLITPRGEAPVDSPLDYISATALVASCSLRRVSQLLSRKPGLRVEPLRGNVETRLEKVRSGAVGATFLAKAGLDRLGIQDQSLIHPLSIQEMIPAAGQGIVAIETLHHSHAIMEAVKPLDVLPSRLAAEAERETVHQLGGTCVSPIAAHALIEGDAMRLMAFVGDPQGTAAITREIIGPVLDRIELAKALVSELFEAGAADLL